MRLFPLQGKYAEAKHLCERSLAIRERVLGPAHPDVAASLNHLAMLLASQVGAVRAHGLQAEERGVRRICTDRFSHFRCSLSMWARGDVGKKRETRVSLLANRRWLRVTALQHFRLLALQGKFLEAEPLYERSQAIREEVLGSEHPDIADSLNNRAVLLTYQVGAVRVHYLQNKREIDAEVRA